MVKIMSEMDSQHTVNQVKHIFTLYIQFAPNSQLLLIAYQDQGHIKLSSCN